MSHTGLPSTVKQARLPLPAKAQTCLPSVEHDAEASDTSAPDGLRYRFAPCSESFCFHFSLPSVPTHRAPRSVAVDRGDEDLVAPDARACTAPMPGILNFQTTFLSRTPLGGEALLGGVAVVLRPAPLRPVVGEGGRGQQERGAKTAQEQKTNHGGDSPRGVKRLAGRDEVIFSSGGVQR